MANDDGMKDLARRVHYRGLEGMRIDWHRLLPRYWLQRLRTDWEWDSALNALLDQHDIKLGGSCTVSIGGVTVWVANFPSSYGQPYGGPAPEFLPSVKTRLRLKRAIDRRLYSQAAPRVTVMPDEAPLTPTQRARWCAALFIMRLAASVGGRDWVADYVDQIVQAAIKLAREQDAAGADGSSAAKPQPDSPPEEKT